MADEEKFPLLKSLKLFRNVPDEQIRKLSEFLAAVVYKDGETIFAEGSRGDSLCFISKGHVRIAKKLRSRELPVAVYKELAVLGPGDCFGEMAVIEEVARSADAIAQGEALIFRLSREDLNRWLGANPALAVGFFAQLVQVLSGHLRRSSNELALLLDLSHFLLERFQSPQQLLGRVMVRLMRYLEGNWCSGAYVYNEFNDEMELVDVEGDFHQVKDSLSLEKRPQGNSWLDDSTYQVVFPGEKRILGFIVFHRSEPLDAEEQNESARTLTTTARLITSGLENLGYRTEEGLRSRLKAVRQAGGY
jgi:CRP/FNR family transcriptional regulator, cyclic AMP receptor protein